MTTLCALVNELKFLRMAPKLKSNARNQDAKLTAMAFCILIHVFVEKNHSFVVLSNHSGIQVAEGKTLLTPRHLLIVFSEPRLSRTLKFVEASRN